MVGAFAVRAWAAGYTVHEWGTFTSVVGSDGRMLPGLEVEEEALPPFVHSLAGFAPANKGWNRPLANVTVKMETPVLYFYSDEARTVDVAVGFRGGSISQWYPERAGGEQLTVPPDNGVPVSPIDFAREYHGSAQWHVDVLPRASERALTARRDWETPQWPRARVPDANHVMVAQGEVEGFIFYRGVGNFALPLEVTSAKQGELALRNTGKGAIPFAFIYEVRAAFPQGVVWWSGPVEAGSTVHAPLLKSVGDIAAPPVIDEALPKALEQAGLTASEARALVATWRESYFGHPGLRVLWIVPRAFTDATLPLTLSPAPEKLARVLVGRTEVLTPEFERELRQEFARDGGKRWESDRYFRAYRARVTQLGGAVGVASVPVGR